MESNSEVTVDMPEESEPITVIEAQQGTQGTNAPTKKPLPTIVITQDDNNSRGTGIQIEEHPVNKGATTTSQIPPLIKPRPVIRSQSESDLEAALKCREQQAKLHDDSLLGIPHSERVVSAKRPTPESQTGSVSLDKYGANQWWAHPLRV
ncbi:hypothetical protein TELCIR_10286 [Teladorsagia circumcincta]|uniref:Uncharacterized protein n=1 Tax=Teladorsagia circumcincta TaxID=45464 RepID=A0A2G9UCI0_TELCI|nr:hypothetical protein TELCIR_10286 [Teladorsagia circumcincta]